MSSVLSPPSDAPNTFSRRAEPGRNMAAALMLGAFGTMFSGPADASAPVANATAAAPNDLARLQELIKELEPAASVAQPKLPDLGPMPMVEEPPRVLETKTAPLEGFPNAEAEGNVMVFDEAEASVERALRRLAPSPGPKPAMNVASKNGKGKYCTKCTDFYNGAVDAPGASMCYKKNSGSKGTACYANHAGCPGDMKSYTCQHRTDEEGAASGICPANVVNAYKELKKDVSSLMDKLIQLKQEEQDLTLQLIDKAEYNNPTCACGPFDQIKGFML